jgi:hypothetical protein
MRIQADRILGKDKSADVLTSRPRYESFIAIAALDQRPDLSVGDAALGHPETIRNL